jgi:hypothetical protein
MPDAGCWMLDKIRKLSFSISSIHRPASSIISTQVDFKSSTHLLGFWPDKTVNTLCDRIEAKEPEIQAIIPGAYDRRVLVDSEALLQVLSKV